MPIRRRRIITDQNGNLVQITSREQLQAIIDQMTPEQKKRFDDQYRFTPVENDIDGLLGLWYEGTLRDLL